MKKQAKRYAVAIVTAAVLVITVSAIAQNQSSGRVQHRVSSPKSLADMVDAVRNCIVRVEVSFPTATSTGTGFLINTDGVVVTARHVIYPRGISQPPTKIKVEIRMPTINSEHIKMIASWNVFPSNVVAVDEAHDIAVLKPTQNSPFPEIRVLHSPPQNITVKPSLGTLDPRQLRDGEPVFTSGYPLELPILITTSGFMASSDPMKFEPSTPHQILDIYWADMQANPGNSGGPLFSLASGNVIGMVVADKLTPVVFADSSTPGQGVTETPNGTISVHPLAANSGITVILPAHYIVELLQSNGIRYEVKRSLSACAPQTLWAAFNRAALGFLGYCTVA
jgi:S1-C subfamily serine protease